MKLVCKQKNNENIADIQIFFNIFCLIDSEDLCFILILRGKTVRFWHLIFLNFEISVSL